MHSTDLSATKSHVDLINMHKTMRIECHRWELEVCEHNVRCQLKHTIDCVTRKKYADCLNVVLFRFISIYSMQN